MIVGQSVRGMESEGESPKIQLSSSVRSSESFGEDQGASTIVVPEFAKSAYLIPTISASRALKIDSEALLGAKSYVLDGNSFEIKEKTLREFIDQRPVVVIDPLVGDISVSNEDKKIGTKLLVDHEASVSVPGCYEKVSAKINNENVVVTLLPVKKETKKSTAEVKPIEKVLEKFGTPPTALALDPELGIFVGTRDGSLYRYSIDSCDGDIVPGGPVTQREVQNIKVFNGGHCLLTKDKENEVRLWSVNGMTSRVALNKAYYGHDYIFDTSVVRSHYSEISNGSWGMPSIPLFASGKNAIYELPMNYLIGTALAKPAVMYAVLLQWLMLQKKASVESKALVAALPNARARSVIEPAIIQAFELCVKEQALRLGHTFVPHNPFSVAKKAESTEK